MSSFSRQQLEEWLKRIEVPAMSKILDVGGSQNPVKGRLGNKGECFEYKILDLEVPHECKQKPDYVFDINETIYFNEEESIWFKEHQKYNIIFCLEVTEYLWNPLQAFNNLNSLLVSGGLLYISSHFIYPVHNPVEEDCLRYTRRGITKLLEKAGFQIEEILPRLCGQNDSEFRDNWRTNDLFRAEGMRPAKGYEFHNEVGNLIKARKK